MPTERNGGEVILLRSAAWFVMFVACAIVVAGELRLPPALSIEFKSELLAIEPTKPCQMSESLAGESERLLSLPYDVLTVQTEAEDLLDLYVACVPSDRAVSFLVDQVRLARNPYHRVVLVRRLGQFAHPDSVACLVSLLGDDEVYAFKESPGRSESLSVNVDAEALLRRLFPDEPARDADGWADWWEESSESYWNSWRQQR